MGVSRNPIGQLRTATLGNINEAVFWSPTQPKSIEPEDSDVVYLIRSHDRLDNIASEQLGDPNLGWIILHRNDLRLAPNDLVPGRNIFIPTRETLSRRGFI